MDNAESIYSNLLLGGKTALDNLLVSDDAEEGYYFDYKQLHNSDGDIKLNSDDLKNYRKALSGFSNSGGGVVIWGVKKSAGKTGAYKLIKNPSKFVEKLNGLLHNAVTPLVEGVINKVLFKESNNSGVILTYVPKGDLVPYKIVSGHYWLRIGDSFKMMEHDHIADMFGRRRGPVLVSKVFAKDVSKGNYNLNISIKNEGKSISQYFGFDLEFPIKRIENSIYRKNPQLFPSGTGGSFDSKIVWRNVFEDSIRPIFPGEELLLTTNHYSLKHLNFTCSVNQMEDWAEKEITMTIYSNDMESKSYKMLFKDIFLTTF